ncbi:MAG TPA: YceI family protein [Arenimonas sp.]|nr:YceI family protein [Arenimonas sp.]
MSHRNRLLPALAALPLLLAAAAAPAADYQSAEGARLVFVSSYEGDSFEGEFARFDARIGFDPSAPEACRFDVRIDLASAATGVPERDGMLQEPDFFDTGRQAEARYLAEGCRANADGSFVADGRLSLRGVEKAVPLTFRWQPGPSPVLEGEAVMDRLAFGVGAGDWGDTDMIPASVAIRTRVPLRPAGD